MNTLPDLGAFCCACDGGGGLNAYLSLSHSWLISCGLGLGAPGGGLGGLPPPLSRTRTSPSASITSCTRCFFGSVHVFLDMSW